MKERLILKLGQRKYKTSLEYRVGQKVKIKKKLMNRGGAVSKVTPDGLIEQISKHEAGPSGTTK